MLARGRLRVTELSYQQNFPPNAAVKAHSILGYSVEGTQKERQKKPSLKTAAQAIAKTVYKYFVELPEEERERKGHCRF